MGAADASGLVVSYIQSLYWEFGSGVVLPRTGVLMQNRGTGFSLDRGALNALEPGRLPPHTLNPALAVLRDGRIMAYGTMGGDAQPQIQAALFTRHVLYRQPLDQALDRPRWFVGRTWGSAHGSVILEGRFDGNLIDRLMSAGHEVDVMAAPYAGEHGPRRRRGPASERHAGSRPRSARRRRCDRVIKFADRARRVPRHRGLHSAALRAIFSRMIRQLSCVAAAVLASLVATVELASAHPHVWVTMRSELVYGPDGTITGIRHAWTFDDMFSAFATQGIDSKQRGVFSREELSRSPRPTSSRSRTSTTSPSPGSTARRPTSSIRPRTTTSNTRTRS